MKKIKLLMSQGHVRLNRFLDSDRPADQALLLFIVLGAEGVLLLLSLVYSHSVIMLAPNAVALVWCSTLNEG